MNVCEYCNREFKSKSGLTNHKKKCKPEEVEVETKEVKVEVCNYYEGHPRRELKLRGLLSRTFDTAEREKICKMLVNEVM